MHASLSAFIFLFWLFFFFSFSLFMICCYGVRGHGKLMALQRNVVYIVMGGWMNGWTDEWMDGCRCPWARAGEGARSLSHHWFFFFCFHIVRKKKIIFCVFVQLYWSKGGAASLKHKNKQTNKNKPCDMKTVRYCLSRSVSFENPLLCSITSLCESTSKLLVRRDVLFLHVFPIRLCDGGGQSSWRLSEKLPPWLCFTCIRLNPASTRSFYKWLSP